MITGKLLDFPISHLRNGKVLIRVSNFNKYRRVRILENGDGWIQTADEWEPVTFYMEDILYRLDLQGKLP